MKKGILFLKIIKKIMIMVGNYNCHRRIKSQINTNINISNIGNDKALNTKKIF